MDNTTFVLDDGATIDANISLTYDDGTRAMVYTDATIDYVDATFVMTLDPTADLEYNTTYALWFSSNLLDSHSVALGSNVTIDFVTAAAPLPTRVLTADISPAHDAVNQTRDVAVTITFNFLVNTTLAEAAIVAGDWATNFTWDDTSMVVTLVHALFTYDTAYTVTVTAGLLSTDATVGALAADATSTFTTMEDPGVVVPVPITVTFGPFDVDEGTAVTLTIGTETYTGTIDENGYVTFDILPSVLVGITDFTIKVGDDEYEGDVADLDDGATIGTDDLTIVKESKPDDDGDSTMIYAIIGIVIVVIILLLVFASRGKKEEEEMPAEDEAGEAGEFECPSCGAMVSSDIGECPECGEVFEEDQFRCPECGAEVEPGMEECAECGETLEIPERPEGEEGEAMEGEEGDEPEGDDFDVESEEEEPMEAFEDEEEEEDVGDEDDDEDDEDDDELDLDDDEDDDEDEEEE
jgi:hypothetical protein